MRQNRTLLVMTVVAALLGAYIFFFEKDMDSTDERRANEKKVLTMDADDVRAVEIAWEGRTVLLEREMDESSADKGEDQEEDASVAFNEASAEWFMREPRMPSSGDEGARADRGSVDGLVSSLLNLQKKRTIEEASRTDLDFNEPRAMVKLTTAGGSSTLEIGPEVAGSSDMLVAIAGEPEVYQVDRSVWDDVVQEPGDWRAKELFSGLRADIDRLSLESGGQKTLLARRGNDFWIESPITDSADKEMVDALLGELTALEAESFVDEMPEPVDLGFDDGRVFEVVLNGEEKPFRVEVGAALPNADEEAAAEDAAHLHYARVNGQVVEVRTSFDAELRRGADEWRSRRWTPMQVYQLDRAVFSDRGFSASPGDVELQRDGGDWWRGDDKIGYNAATDILYSLTDARADEVLERSTAASMLAGEPDLKITLLDGDEDEESNATSPEMSLYVQDDGRGAAMIDDREAVLVLSSETVDKIRDHFEALVAAEAMEDPPSDAETADD